MNYFEYNGVRSCDMGVRIEKKNVFSAPKYDVSFESIPGRDGDLILPGGRFPNVQVTYSVFVPAHSTAELADKLTAVKAWLYAEPDRYHILRDTYDTHFFRKAVFSTKLNITDEVNRIGTFTVSFSCHPFRYSEEGQKAVVVPNNEMITNPYPFASKPLIRIKCTGGGTLLIASTSTNTIQSIAISDIHGELSIDSEMMNCFSGAEPKNDCVTSKGFPTLPFGDSYIIYSGGITEVSIVPRWCTL